jgi:hypothetical protein
MEERDKILENFLREFAPKRPKVLREDVQSRGMLQWRLLAAVGIAMLTGSAVWVASRKETFRPQEIRAKEAENGAISLGPERRDSILMLTKIVLDEPQRLDEVLSEKGRGTLPKLTGNDSTLRALAKE